MGRKKSADPLDIPEFLLVKNRRPVKPGAPLVMSAVRREEPEVKYDWRYPRSAFTDPASLKLMTEMDSARRARRDAALAALRDRPKTPRVDPFAGKVRLADILAGLGPGAPTPGQARRIVEEAHVLHSKYHFNHDQVAGVRKILSEWEPERRESLVGVISVVTRKNPRRPNTGQFDRYEVILRCDGRGVVEYFECGGDKDALTYAVKQGHVKLEDERETNRVRNEQPSVERPAVRAVPRADRMRGKQTVADDKRGERNDEASVSPRARPKKSGDRSVDRSRGKTGGTGGARKSARKRRGAAR